jgi:hypothetical protein
VSEIYINRLNVREGKQGKMTGTSIGLLNRSGKVMCDKDKEIQVPHTLRKLMYKFCLLACIEGSAYAVGALHLFQSVSVMSGGVGF